MSDASDLEPIAFLGLGKMGLPMASRLVANGFQVRGFDLSADRRAAFEEQGGISFSSAEEAVRRCGTLITMLPTGAHVAEQLTGAGNLASVLPPGGLVIDMSSSGPGGTRDLAHSLRAMGLRMIDAPVSGGVARAIKGTLTIIAGGEKSDIDEARPLFEAMGNNLFHAGPAGAGHAVKALNNYVSAAGLVAACEAMIVGGRFGVEPDTLVDILNASTGRNNSTDVKMKQFVISESFASGFSLALMSKDLDTAAELAREVGYQTGEIAAIASLWREARAALPDSADHTEIFTFLESAPQR